MVGLGEAVTMRILLGVLGSAHGNHHLVTLTHAGLRDSVNGILPVNQLLPWSTHSPREPEVRASEGVWISCCGQHTCYACVATCRLVCTRR